jgi:hypothetical protein
MSQTPPDHEELSTATVLALKLAMRSDDGARGWREGRVPLQSGRALTPSTSGGRTVLTSLVSRTFIATLTTSLSVES